MVTVYNKGNYRAMLLRIKIAATVEVLEKISRSMDNLMAVGAFTPKEFELLDTAWCDHFNKLYENNNER